MGKKNRSQECFSAPCRPRVAWDGTSAKLVSKWACADLSQGSMWPWVAEFLGSFLHSGLCTQFNVLVGSEIILLQIYSNLKRMWGNY
jgi:hypothetical protein